MLGQHGQVTPDRDMVPPPSALSVALRCAVVPVDSGTPLRTANTTPSFAAFGQQLYAFALGVLYAYWFEKSKSVVAPIVGHNVSDLTEYAICFALIALWR